MNRGSTICNRSSGFSLIELAISMVIGLVVTLVVSTVLLRSEGSKRSTTSVNDISQSGAYASYVIDREIRSAGTGYSQNWSTVYGCLLNAKLPGGQLLPATIPTTTNAFANVSAATLPARLTPVVIGKDLANAGGEVRGDVLMVMAGAAGVAETPLQVKPGSVMSATLAPAAQLELPNSLGFNKNNILLLADAGMPGCMVQEIGTPAAASGIMPLSGSYYSETGASVGLADFSAGQPWVIQLGTETVNPPHFELFGVGTNNSLYSYDLLQVGGNEQPVADGVVEMRALYGLDTSFPHAGVIDSWVDASGVYAATNLLNGAPASQALLRQIVAVKVGFFMRTSLQERAPAGLNNPEGYLQPNNTTLTLFADTVDAAGNSLAKTRVLTGDDLYYRFRLIEVTIPILNVLSAPQS